MNLLVSLWIISSVLVILMLTIFISISFHSKWEKDSSATFECGFTSGFISRFSFSMHFYTVGLIFLFLDLELCFVMPFFNEEIYNLKVMGLMWFFVWILLMGILLEWWKGELEWKF